MLRKSKFNPFCLFRRRINILVPGMVQCTATRRYEVNGGYRRGDHQASINSKYKTKGRSKVDELGPTSNGRNTHLSFLRAHAGMPIAIDGLSYGNTENVGSEAVGCALTYVIDKWASIPGQYILLSTIQGGQTH